MAARKKTPKTIKPKKASAPKNVTSIEEPRSSAGLPYLKWIVLLVILGVLAFAFKSLFVVALVNNQPITRIELVKELERQGAEQTLNALISQKLIEQEAAKKKVVVAQKEIDAELKEIDEQLKAQGQSLDQILTAQGLARSDVEKQTKVRIMLEKLLADKVKVTEAEVSEAYEAQKDGFAEGTSPEEARAQVEQNLRDQKLSTEVQVYLDTLQKQAKIQYFKEY